jgi:uncharacterized membrane protein
MTQASPPVGVAEELERPLKGGVSVQKTVTILRPAEDVFAAFQSFALVPRFVGHVQSITENGPGRWRWVARLGQEDTVEWDAVVVDEEAPHRLAWEAVEGGAVRSRGSITLRPAPADRGTELTVSLDYAPPLGQAGRSVLKLLGEEPKQEITRDLYRLRQLLEAGVIATTEGQPSGRAAR